MIECDPAFGVGAGAVTLETESRPRFLHLKFPFSVCIPGFGEEVAAVGFCVRSGALCGLLLLSCGREVFGCRGAACERFCGEKAVGLRGRSGSWNGPTAFI